MQMQIGKSRSGLALAAWARIHSGGGQVHFPMRGGRVSSPLILSRMPLTNFPLSCVEYFFGDIDRLVYGHNGRDIVTIVHFVDGQA